MNIDEILVNPHITEKTNTESAKGVYTFKVSAKSNKIIIANALEKLFSVKVDKVRIVVQKPKIKTNVRTGKKNTKSAFKKAYVYIRDRKKIPELDM